MKKACMAVLALMIAGSISAFAEGTASAASTKSSGTVATATVAKTERLTAEVVSFTAATAKDKAVLTVKAADKNISFKIPAALKVKDLDGTTSAVSDLKAGTKVTITHAEKSSVAKSVALAK